MKLVYRNARFKNDETPQKTSLFEKTSLPKLFTLDPSQHLSPKTNPFPFPKKTFDPTFSMFPLPFLWLHSSEQDSNKRNHTQRLVCLPDELLSNPQK